MNEQGVAIRKHISTEREESKGEGLVGIRDHEKDKRGTMPGLFTEHHERQC